MAPDTEQPTGLTLDRLAPEDAAVLLAERHPGVMSPAHRTMATSLWLLYGHADDALPNLIAMLDTESKRFIWQGRPYVPAVRWEFPDGSGLVQTGPRIRAGVHESRQDAIRERCLDAIQEANRVNGNSAMAWSRGWTPLAPHTAFVPASDGILSHQAALPAPVDVARCWCGRHDAEPDRVINAVRQ